MRERTIKKQFWINQDEENLLMSKSKVNSTKYIRNQDLEYIKNTIPKFMLVTELLIDMLQ